MGSEAVFDQQVPQVLACRRIVRLASPDNSTLYMAGYGWTYGWRGGPVPAMIRKCVMFFCCKT